VARYYEISDDAADTTLGWKEIADKKAIARKLDGCYILRTD
jgi:hypothetical protein